MGLFDSLESMAGDQIHQALAGALDNAAPGGVEGVLTKLQQGGLGEVVSAWCSGEHLPISPDQLQSALGDEHVQQIAQSMGVDPDQALATLAQHLPKLAAAQADESN